MKKTMKMKKRKKKWRNKKKGHRNAAPIAVTPRRRSRLPRRGAAPDWKTTLAALAGGAGGATLGGLVVNQQILSPEAVGLGMIGLGGATAYFADGNTRVLGNSVAAAGAGQLALALMARRAITGEKVPVAPTKPAEAAPPLLSAPSAGTTDGAPPRRKSANGGGVVVDLFRDAALELEELDDLEHEGPRDAGFVEEDLIYDVDEAA